MANVKRWSIIDFSLSLTQVSMEQHTLKCKQLFEYTNIYSYLETSGGQSSNLFLNVVHFFNTRVI